ncbi:MAG: hypothetical protein JW834_00580 [Candidatus Diapherotrites archaeon]|nr:hypothetical protein [Candidatus Diapherotrites archaeon]
MKKFCPKCGAEGKPMHKGFCIDCYLADHPDIVEIQDMEIEECPNCLRAHLGKNWTSSELEPFIASKVKTKLSEPTITASIVGETEKGPVMLIKVAGRLGENEAELSKEIQITLRKRQCDVCSKKQSTYHNAKMQLRGPEEAVTDAFRAVRNENRSTSRKERMAEVFRFEEVKDGVDVYLGSAQAAKNAAAKLVNKGAKVKTTYKLVGLDRKTGKRRYEITYSVRMQ